MIKAVIFDLDGVLFNSFQANLSFYQRVMKAIGGKKITGNDYQNMFHLTRKEVIQAHCPHFSSTEIKKAFQISQGIPYDYSLIKLEKTAKETLESLKKDYQLAVVTGRSTDKGLEHFSLRDYFSVMVTCLDYQKPKPDPEPLLIACQKLNIKPAEAVYIGDSPVDQEASRSAGCHFVAYGDKLEAQFQVKQLKEILPILDQINQGGSK